MWVNDLDMLTKIQLLEDSPTVLAGAILSWNCMFPRVKKWRVILSYEEWEKDSMPTRKSRSNDGTRCTFGDDQRMGAPIDWLRALPNRLSTLASSTSGGSHDVADATPPPTKGSSKLSFSRVALSRGP